MGITSRILRELEAYESRNLVCVDAGVGWPIVWARAKGVHVWDVEGRRYLDLTAAFGVAAAGHANGRVVEAGRKQMGTLLHAMGDVHPHEGKARLARELSRLTFERWSRGRGRLTGKVVFCNSGFEAVEAALKTAMLLTGRPGVLGFSGGYHGLGYGALSLTHRREFRDPFQRQLGGFGHFAAFPSADEDLGVVEGRVRRALGRHSIGAVLVEPIQGRGGMRVPPPGFLRMLRSVCDERGMVLILDEIYTGFGRTGRWFACEHEGVIPDLICLGKALTGGFPLSVCVGEALMMDRAWPRSTGEAIHTSTYLGHPVGCAMALAQMAELRSRKLVGRSARLGPILMRLLGRLEAGLEVRGRGLMVGVDFSVLGKGAGVVVLKVVQEMLRRGFILLPDGDRGQVLALTPPLCITERQLESLVKPLTQTVRGLLCP